MSEIGWKGVFGAICDVISGFSIIFDLSHYITTRWPKIVNFIFSKKNIFSHGYDVIGMGKWRVLLLNAPAVD